MNSSTPIRNGNYSSPARNQATRNRNAIVFAESSFTTPPRNDLRDRRLLSPPALVQNNHRSRRPRVSQSTRNFSDFAFNLDACLAQLSVSSGRNIDDTFVVNKDEEELDCEVADINRNPATVRHDGPSFDKPHSGLNSSSTFQPQTTFNTCIHLLLSLLMIVYATFYEAHDA